VAVVINPSELVKRARDTARINELSSINRAIGYYQTTVSNPSLGSPNTVYVSLPDNASSTCGSWSLPPLPPGWTYSCKTDANYRKVDGTGWIPINFSSMPTGAPFGALPIDPVNDQNYYYTYVTGGSWALSALLESEKQLKERALKDGGYDPGRFEVGSNLRLIAQSEGLVGWWPFDEGSGTTANDSSGNNNNGTLVNGPTWTTGKLGGALSFDGVNDYVGLGNPSSLNFSGQITFGAWIKPQANDGLRNIAAHGYRLSPNQEVFFRINTGSYQVGSWDGDSRVTSYAIPAEDVNNWVHLVGLYDGSNWKLYRNGVAVSSASYSVGAITVSENWAIGARGTGTERFFNGLIDDVRLYNRALSDTEIKALYYATK
jgi:hypothetical protein